MEEEVVDEEMKESRVIRSKWKKDLNLNAQIQLEEARAKRDSQLVKLRKIGVMVRTSFSLRVLSFRGQISLSFQNRRISLVSAAASWSWPESSRIYWDRIWSEQNEDAGKWFWFSPIFIQWSKSKILTNYWLCPECIHGTGRICWSYAKEKKFHCFQEMNFEQLQLEIELFKRSELLYKKKLIKFMNMVRFLSYHV